MVIDAPQMMKALTDRDEHIVYMDFVVFESALVKAQNSPLAAVNNDENFLFRGSYENKGL